MAPYLLNLVSSLDPFKSQVNEETFSGKLAKSPDVNFIKIYAGLPEAMNTEAKEYENTVILYYILAQVSYQHMLEFLNQWINHVPHNKSNMMNVII